MPRLYALYDHWREYPPVHVSAALFLGLGNKNSSEVSEQAEEKAIEYAQALPAMIIKRPT